METSQPHLSQPDPEQRFAEAGPANRSAQRSFKGSSTTTGQVRLKPKRSSQSIAESNTAPYTTSLESGISASGQNVSILQPVDEGFAAWSYVAGAFAMYIVVWGFPQAFPIFQTHLSTGPDATYPGSVIIRLLAPGIQDIEEGILFQVLPKANRHRPTLVLVGISTMIIAVFLASCATTDWQVVLTQGLLFGVGGILLNFVHVSIFPEWFDKKQGQAMGIIWTGYRIGALAFPPICQWLLEKHGYEESLRVLIFPMLTLLLPSIVLLRGRYTAATVVSQAPEPSVSKLQALRQPNVLYFLVASALWDFVINVPYMFITTFAADLGLSRTDQTLAFTLVQISNLLGTYGCGWLSDQGFHEELLGGIAILTALTHFLLWGFCKSKLFLFVYALAVGFTSGGFDNCLFPFYTKVARGNNELFTAVHSLFSFVGGFAILSVGPIGAGILRQSPALDASSYAIGKYQYLVLYAGGLCLISGIMLLARKFAGLINLHNSQRSAE